jgi:uncharacterized membrane protein
MKTIVALLSLPLAIAIIFAVLYLGAMLNLSGRAIGIALVAAFVLPVLTAIWMQKRK